MKHTATLSLSRRRALGLWCGHCVGLAGLFSGLPANAQTNAQPLGPTAPVRGPLDPAALANAPRFTRPGTDSDEGGLWSLMDREETRLRRSPFLVRDKELTAYLEAMLCRLNKVHCPDLRIHIVRTPHFNASMAPNGMMQIWTGLLLRVENEAQLAAVVAHEMGHYLERHSLEQLRDLKGRAAAAMVMGLFGAVGAIGQLGTLAGAFSFSRENESRADQMSMYLLQKAGYDGREAARIWDNLIAELRVTGGEDAGRKSPMFASHPPPQNRAEDLLRLADGRGGDADTQALRRVTARFRLDWLQDEIKRGQFEESLILFNRLLKAAPDDAQVLFSRGEIHRQRAAKDDLDAAMTDLTRAGTLPGAPAETWRAVGLIHKQRQQAAAAVDAFERYLTVLPNAADAGLIRNYINELKP